MPQKKIEVLVDLRFWKKVEQRLSTSDAHWVRDNRGRSETKLLNPTTLLRIHSDYIAANAILSQLIRSSVSARMKAFASVKDVNALLKRVEKAMVAALVELGEVPQSIQFCGKPVVKPEKPLASTQSHGFVYFIRNQDIYKIGITENLLRRLGELQPDEILNVVRCSNYEQVERSLHSEFKSARIPQTEYFRLTADQVEAAHASIIRLAEF